MLILTLPLLGSRAVRSSCKSRGTEELGDSLFDQHLSLLESLSDTLLRLQKLLGSCPEETTYCVADCIYK